VENKRKSPVNLVLDIVIVLLCLALVAAAAFAVSSFRDSFGWAYDADSFYYRLSDGDYGSAVEMYYLNEANKVKADDELRQYYAVAEYFEAASFYKAFRDAGDEGSAERYLARMEDAERRMGVLSFEAGKIDDILGID